MAHRPGSSLGSGRTMSHKWRLTLLILVLFGFLQTRSTAENRPAWIEIRSPNFIVVTNANESQGRRTAYQFEMIRAVFRDFFGQKGKSQELPITIVAAKDEKTLKALLPEFWEKKGLAHPAGVCLNTADTGANYIALQLDVILNQEAIEPFEPVYHEYVHYLTRRLAAHWPVWLIEGFAEYYGNIRINGDQVFVGAPSTSHIQFLQETSLLPLSTLFEADHSSPYYNEKNKASIFYAESWALTHYLMMRDAQEKTRRLSDFLGLLAKGVDQREAATGTIGDPKSLEPELRKYVRKSKFGAVPIALPKLNENGFQARGLSDAESLAVRADFMAHDHHYAEAQTMLEEALKMNPKLAAACESMSFLSLQQGKQGEAEKWARQAVELDPQSYWGNYYYAWSLLRSRQDEESIAKAQTSLRTVVKINPAFGPAYDTLAYALGLPGSHQDLKEAHSMTLWAVQCDPGNIQYRLRAVSLLEQMGEADNAVRVATQAAKMANTPEEQTTASQALENAQKFQAFTRNNKEHSRAQRSEVAEANALVVPAPAAIGNGAVVPITASAEIMVLGDTNGFDFGPYLNKEVLPTLQKAWLKLASSDLGPSAAKKTKAVIEFAILKDGALGEMNLKESSNDATLDAAVLKSFKAATPFRALPAQFNGKSLALRFELSFSPIAGSE
jgi:tetratricopeptide (TPR) repeat protein